MGEGEIQKSKWPLAETAAPIVFMPTSAILEQ